MEKMNIFQKLAKARAELVSMNLKKSGKNTFANYQYFELDDILPATTKLEDKYGMLSIINFHETTAELTLLNTESPEEKIIFECQLKESDIKGASPIQQYGGIQTYTRRYLTLNCWNITEPDVGEITFNPNEKKKEQPKQEQAPTTPERKYVDVNNITLEDALKQTTAKGMKYADMDEEKLDFIIANAKSPYSKRCAELIKESRQKELEEMAKESEKLGEIDSNGDLPF